MDIPMINEINENTNAAKNEILQAMPAAGATSAEVEAAKTAIIGAMPSGGDAVVVSSVLSYGTSGTGGSDVTVVNSSGKGFINLTLRSSGSSEESKVYATVIVDGVTVINKKGPQNIGFNTYVDSMYMAHVSFKFNKSIKVVVRGSSSIYHMKYYAGVYFEG